MLYLSFLPTIYLICDTLFSVSSQLKSQIESSSVTDNASQATSGSEMEEDVIDSSINIPASKPTPLTDATATFPVPTSSKGGQGKSTKKTGVSTTLNRGGGGVVQRSDDEEAAVIIDKLQRQQVEAGNMQEQIALPLEKDQATAMAHFGPSWGNSVPR